MSQREYNALQRKNELLQLEVSQLEELLSMERRHSADLMRGIEERKEIDDYVINGKHIPFHVLYKI